VSSSTLLGGLAAWRPLVLVLAIAACRGGAATGSPSSGEALPEAAVEAGATATPRDPLVEDLWQQAADGELADLARLHDREGDTGLIERAAVPAYRMTALAALACGDDFEALPFLADVAASGTDAEADVALASAQSLAAVPRRARDPEDALELRQGCERLLGLARKVDAPRSRRAKAISALRMLESTGCLRGEAPPIDLDAK
jgi:hypothetical protein